MAKTAPKRTARRVNEQRAQISSEPVAAATPTPETTKAAEPPAPEPTKVQKLSLMYDGDRFLVDRMERSTVDRFRVMARNTPELFDAGEGGSEDFDLDVSAWIAQAYGLLFTGAGIVLVRANRLHVDQLDAFRNAERISKLVPRTEKAIEDQFGAKLRALPPLVQLALSIVGVAGSMYQDAQQIEIGPRAVTIPHKVER